jgi:hypothetical protein
MQRRGAVAEEYSWLQLDKRARTKISSAFLTAYSICPRKSSALTFAEGVWGSGRSYPCMRLVRMHGSSVLCVEQWTGYQCFDFIPARNVSG